DRAVFRAKDDSDTLFLLIHGFGVQEVIIQYPNLFQLQAAIARQAQIVAAPQNIDHAIQIAAGVVASSLLRCLGGTFHFKGVSGLDSGFDSEGATDTCNRVIYLRAVY